jgi:hypothetical protein
MAGRCDTGDGGRCAIDRNGRWCPSNDRIARFAISGSDRSCGKRNRRTCHRREGVKRKRRDRRCRRDRRARQRNRQRDRGRTICIVDRRRCQLERERRGSRNAIQSESCLVIGDMQLDCAHCVYPQYQ